MCNEKLLFYKFYHISVNLDVQIYKGVPVASCGFISSYVCTFLPYFMMVHDDFPHRNVQITVMKSWLQTLQFFFGFILISIMQYKHALITDNLPHSD